MTSALASQTRRASAAQVSYIKILLSQIAALDPKQADDLREDLNASWSAGEFTVTKASKVIELLIALINGINAQIASQTKSAVDVPDGRYAVRTDEGHFAFYRVWNGDRAVCVYQQLSDDEQRVPRATAKAVLAKISDVGPLEASKAYGQKIGVCGVCHRTLTNPDSIAAGIGPVCAGKF